jgi:hypothetical protein
VTLNSTCGRKVRLYPSTCCAALSFGNILIVMGPSLFLGALLNVVGLVSELLGNHEKENVRVNVMLRIIRVNIFAYKNKCL